MNIDRCRNKRLRCTTQRRDHKVPHCIGAGLCERMGRVPVSAGGAVTEVPEITGARRAIPLLTYCTVSGTQPLAGFGRKFEEGAATTFTGTCNCTGVLLPHWSLTVTV